MRYLILGLIMFIFVSTIIATSMHPIKVEYTNYSETHCVGKTCSHYLLSQMGNKTLNITSDKKPDMCKCANWNKCN